VLVRNPQELDSLQYSMLNILWLLVAVVLAMDMLAVVVVQVGI
jgi:hypothetical protein